MKKNINLVLSAAFGVVLLGGAPVSAHAQADISSQIIPSLDYEQADVREAISALFKSVGANYVVDPSVEGAVTVHLKDQTFSTDLENILRQVDATYRVENGIYQIVHREVNAEPTSETTNPTPEANTVVARIYIRFADPQLIALLIGQKKGSQRWAGYPEITALSKSQGRGGSGGGGGGGRGGSGGGSGGGFGGGSSGGGGFGGGSSGGSSFGGGGGSSFGGGGGSSFGGGGGGRGF